MLDVVFLLPHPHLFNNKKKFRFERKNCDKIEKYEKFEDGRTCGFTLMDQGSKGVPMMESNPYGSKIMEEKENYISGFKPCQVHFYSHFSTFVFKEIVISKFWKNFKKKNFKKKKFKKKFQKKILNKFQKHEHSLNPGSFTDVLYDLECKKYSHCRSTQPKQL